MCGHACGDVRIGVTLGAARRTYDYTAGADGVVGTLSDPVRGSYAALMPIQPRTPDITNLLITNGEAADLVRVSMSAVGWKEREDLQRWVRDHSHLIEPDLLLISEEFADWEGPSGPVHDRLDLLFLDPPALL